MKYTIIFHDKGEWFIERTDYLNVAINRYNSLRNYEDSQVAIFDDFDKANEYYEVLTRWGER